MREHLHVSQVAGTELELAGDRHHEAGGNAVLEVLGASPVAGGSSPTPAPNVSGGGSPRDMTVANTKGGATSVAKVQFGVAGLFLVAVAALVLLHRVGFRFSITVG